MRWRFIELEARNACSNMAIDQAVMEGVAKGASEPTIRFYRWLPSAVTIGRFQSMMDEVDVGRCAELGVSHVRRITGGGAVYHDYAGEVTYSVIAPEAYFPNGIRESYAFICDWVVSGLLGVGIKAKFVPINDIVTDGKKISGNAQTRRGGVLLQHGTILYNLEMAKMFSLLKISKEKISDKLIKSVEDRVTCVSRYSDITIDGLYRELVRAFSDGKDHYIGSYTEAEKVWGEGLESSVYGSDDWNFSR